MTKYVLHSDSLAGRFGPKTYEVKEGETTRRVEGVATSDDPNRYIAKDGHVVAAGDEVKFISSTQLQLERDREVGLPEFGF